MAIPLLQSQDEAAVQLRGRLVRWAATDRALERLARQIPDFGFEASLIKVAAINQLYGTNIYAVARMAEHVSRIMTTTPDTTQEVELVERLAALPPACSDQKERKHLSFASKFAHFFIDDKRFPIYDSYAVEMLSYHLGAAGQVKDSDHPYRAYLINLVTLRNSLGFACSYRELDHYLWLAGLYRAWTRNPNAQINTEVATMLLSGGTELTKTLHELWPSPQSRSNVEVA